MAIKPNRERRDRWERLTTDGDLMETICEHVSNGGTVIKLCEVWDIPFSWPMKWIRGDAERNRLYEAALADRNEWAKEKILNELRFIGDTDVRRLFADNGKVQDVSQWSEEIARAVSSIEVIEQFEGFGDNRQYVGDLKKIKLHDKLKALELHGKNLALFVDKKEIIGKLTLEDLVESANKAREDHPYVKEEAIKI